MRIAVSGSCVIEASGHLRFGPVGVARYLLAGSGSAYDPPESALRCLTAGLAR
jgi:hypothetical protein